MSDGQIEGFKKLYDELMRYCVRRGIALADAEDLVGSCLEAALRSYDPLRGSFAALAQRSLENRVKNYWRDRRPLVPIEGAEGIEDPDPLPDAIDEGTREHEQLRGIMAELTSAEKSFLVVLQSVLSEMDTRAVSETARRMGMPPAKGWDLFRKIQRKAARTIVSDQVSMKYDRSVKLPPEDLRPLEMPAVLRERMVMNESAAPAPAFTPPEWVDENIRALAASAAMEDAFVRFYSGLPGESLALLKELP